MKQEAIGTTRSEEWETPQWLYDILDAEFHFRLDPCATAENAKCENYFTVKDNGLWQDWFVYDSIFMNPPYGRGIKKWIQKAFEESQRGCTVVCLIFNRSDTRWFHDWVLGKAAEIRVIKGRLTFGGSPNSAPFPSIIVVYRPGLGYTRIYNSTILVVQDRP